MDELKQQDEDIQCKMVETIPCERYDTDDDLEDAILCESNDSVAGDVCPSTPGNWSLLSDDASEIDDSILNTSNDDQDSEDN